MKTFTCKVGCIFDKSLVDLINWTMSFFPVTARNNLFQYDWFVFLAFHLYEICGLADKLQSMTSLHSFLSSMCFFIWVPWHLTGLELVILIVLVNIHSFPFPSSHFNLIVIFIIMFMSHGGFWYISEVGNDTFSTVFI